MPPRTYHVAVAFRVDGEGELHAAEAMEAPTPQSAVAKAKRLALKAKGAVAFSRRGDVDRGEYADAEIHLALGELPADVKHYVNRAT